MKSKRILILVVAALICGGIAGYASARVADSGPKPIVEPRIITVEQIHFVDGRGKLQATLEIGAGRGGGLILKDATGKFLYDLPPSLRALPAGK